ncbi:hypothetical protein IWW37_004857 [Coemansia sp. RSA 2050]|nr:hypothetical protein IWW37_004857 [Coemansia sp. RSA 2050]KAJ2731080.1 hypothetical protein IW152_004786 [Coemansia sp. BCRC 34962]
MDAKATKNLTLTAGKPFVLQYQESVKSSRFIEPAHKGPVMIYLAPLESNGEGDVWFKIFEKGFDPKTKKFYNEELMLTEGRMEFAIPEDIPAGNYLMRTEVIALHQADDEGKAEFYPNCAQIKLISEGTAKPKGYAIPGIYSPKDPGLLIDIYSKVTSYKIPGPPMYSEDLEVTPVNQEGENPEEEENPGDEKPSKKPANPKPTTKTKKPCVRKNKRHYK